LASYSGEFQHAEPGDDDDEVITGKQPADVVDGGFSGGFDLVPPSHSSRPSSPSLPAGYGEHTALRG
jgi:hypothetical protein